ncbi:phosphate-starvation-inducible PsiE family protein [Alkalinema pantanalense CENA528]|uniref:phosphate-starvation-inducible PsiE family protein n=1 Tax=Alkalinema pantanalense TaxID=1620705 RepID=UPI003D6F9766
MRGLWRFLRRSWNDDVFLNRLGRVETLVSKVLSIGMLVLILMAVYELAHYMSVEIQGLFFPAPNTVPTDDPAQVKKFGKALFTIFGLFLNVLIALEILENITAYLKKHVVQVELVIVTSLIAVARKIIILDLEKTGGLDLLALAATILALATAYWVVKNVNLSSDGSH